MTIDNPASPTSPEQEPDHPSRGAMPPTIKYPTQQGSSLNSRDDLYDLIYPLLQKQLEAGDASFIDKLIQVYAKQIDSKKQVRIGKENTTRFIIATLLSAFLASLGYAMVTKDSALVDKMFTLAAGLVGGSGGTALLGQNAKKNDRD
jgi:hypothetical protein